MPFAYYERLTRRQQRVYRQSDEIAAIPIPGVADLCPLVAAVQETLASGDRGRTQAAADRLLAEIARRLDTPPLRTQVLAVRPARRWGELHGLYHPPEVGRTALVHVWMRTAARQLDYALLRLPDSFHTEGLYKREPSLLRQLLPPASEHDHDGR